uniref:Plasmid stabilization system protein n=1 Tax=Acetithermum autotrophicum TaxID=1446466 RepID=H5SSX3_ACEAU|nr:plasmid stabilization system protein [Candidatus Acetothermum autotrophicum]
MRYRILIESRAERELKALPPEIITRIDRKLQALAGNPRPRGTQKLRGREGEGYRVRVGDYRILYQIDDAQKVVRVYRIKHRREAYRRR